MAVPGNGTESGLQANSNVDPGSLESGSFIPVSSIPRVRKNGSMAKNVLGTDLEDCSHDPATGFYRNGCCDTGSDDVGVHTVCAEMTADFLAFSRAVGNDLSTPQPWFPGLKAGDFWCLCAARWVEAFTAGAAPRVRLEATHAATLEFASLADLKRHAL